MMKILVTGAGGYVGSILCKFLLEQNYQLVAVDNYLTGEEEVLHRLQQQYGQDQIKVVKADLTTDDLSSVFKDKQIKIVAHLASFSVVNESMQNPGKYFKNNLMSSINLLEAMIKHKVKKIVFASSSAVYGEAQHSPVDEDHPTQPINPYGESKLMIEKIIHWYQQIYGLRFVTLRFFNISGAWDDGSIGDNRQPSSAMIQNAVRGALGIEKFYLTFSPVETEDGSPIRDYVDVVDVAQVIQAAISYLQHKRKSLTLNIGSGQGHSVLEILTIIKGILKTPAFFQTNKIRQGEPAKIVADTSLAKKYLAWQAHRELTQSIESLVNWYTLNSKKKSKA